MSYKQALVDRSNSKNPQPLQALRQAGELDQFLNQVEKESKAQEDRLFQQVLAQDKEKGLSQPQRESRARSVARELVQQGLNDLA